jgi:hypothetical protein
VGQKKPNVFGLYDMLGNVWKWCQGWFGPYPDDAVIDPLGAPAGDQHPTRGGCYYCDAVHERAARRNRDLEDHSSRSIGFRIAAVPGKVGAPQFVFSSPTPTATLGVPVGIEFLGRPWSEHVLIEIAYGYEKATKHRRPPPVPPPPSFSNTR